MCVSYYVYPVSPRFLTTKSKMSKILVLRRRKIYRNTSTTHADIKKLSVRKQKPSL